VPVNRAVKKLGSRRQDLCITLAHANKKVVGYCNVKGCESSIAVKDGTGDLLHHIYYKYGDIDTHPALSSLCNVHRNSVT
jgi:hypothetical protein